MQEEIVAVYSPRRTTTQKDRVPALDEARAELVTLGGGVLLALCLILTTVLIASFLLPEVTAAQRAIAFILFGGSWIYLIDSATERIVLRDGSLRYKSLFSAAKEYEFVELEAVYLVHRRFNLEKGFDTIVLHRSGREPENLSLGPCWERGKLECLMRGIGQALKASDDE